MDLDHFYFDNIDFKNIDKTLILITNIFQVSEFKQDGPAEEGEMIKVSQELGLKNENKYPIYHHYHTQLVHIDFVHFDLNHVELDQNILITFI